MQSLLSRLFGVSRPPVKPEVLRYATVGGFGFAVDLGILSLLHSGFGMSPLVARAVSILVSIFATWVLHRRWTFRQHGNSSRLKSLSLFLAVQGVSGAIAYVTFSVLVLGFAVMAAWPAVALVFSDLIAVLLNYFGAKHLAFRSPHRHS